MLVRRTERADGSTQAVGAQVGVGAANARTAVPLSAVEGEAKNVSRRVPLATNPLCRKANNASAPHCGKKAMIVTILLAVENGARSLYLKALCTREVSDNSDSR